jgi:hypothetical protein
MDIFEHYTNIAIQKGLLKAAAPRIHDDGTKKPESKQLKSYKNDDMPRADSYSIKDIEKLYGVKPDTVYDYERNIAEDAHPDKVILFPAYDKMNALVENVNEQQRINLNIMRQPPSGLEYRQKYADLMTSLVSLANDLDFKHNSLTKLADHTIDHLQKEALDLADAKQWLGDKLQWGEDIGEATTVGSVAGGLIGALTGGWGGAMAGARIGGIASAAIAAIFKTAPIAKNVQMNAKVAKDKLDTLMKDHPNDMFLSQLSAALIHIQGTAITYATTVSQMQSSHGSQEQAQEIGEAYIKEIQALDRMIDVFLSNASAGKYVSDTPGWLEKIESPFKTIFGDALQDAIKAFQTLETITHQAIDSIMHAKEQSSQAVENAALPQKQPEESEMDVLRKVLQGK